MATPRLLAVWHSSTLADRLAPLRDECITTWRHAPPELPRIGPPTSPWRKWRNARAAGRLIDDLAGRVDSYPAQAPERAAWRDAVRHRFQDFGEHHLGWPRGYRRLLFGDAFYESAIAFARQARAFDPTLRLDDLWQALRNVWIGNNLQMLLGARVRLTPGLFAYSMLYPVTDNLLDAHDVSPADKRRFNSRLGRRLTGERLLPERAAESAAFELVGCIEEEFPRQRCMDAWDSVFAIHQGQIDSLSQQCGPLPEERVLEISFAKGGASVLADLYLVAGEASPKQERFAFGYGVFLQLLDDLQDVTTDLAAGHETLFTQSARRGHLDDLTARLLQFIDTIIAGEHAVPGSATGDCLDLIRRNCHSMLAGVMADQPGLFSGSVRRALERQWPLSFRATRRVRTRARRRFQATAQRLQARYGVSSPLELLLAES